MQRSLEKLRRRVESQIAARQGPARKEQAAAPIADAMRDFWERDMLTFGIPAHNGGRGPRPEFTPPGADRCRPARARRRVAVTIGSSCEKSVELLVISAASTICCSL